MRHRSCNAIGGFSPLHNHGGFLLPFTWLLSLSLLPCPSHASVYTHNETSRVATYPSLPALFGEPFLDNRMYEGTLQYLVEDPFLCNPIPNIHNSSFIEPPPQQEGEEQPIVLLAARGQCPFHYKAMVAESLGARVEYLIVYNHNLDGEDILVPMYSEYGTTRLKLLSVTHRTGLALKQYIADASDETMQRGGPLLSMDSLPPEGIMSAQDLQDALISTLGLFFMLVSFSGCFLMCAAAAQHGRHRHFQLTQQQQQQQGNNNNNTPSPIWMILLGDPDTDPVVVGDPAAAARALAGGRTLLTLEEVEDYLMNRDNDEDGGAGVSAGEPPQTGALAPPTSTPPPENTLNHNPHERTPESSPPAGSGGVEPSDPAAQQQQQQQQDTSAHCAICIDDFDEHNQEGILRLPCNHAFHSDCIVPWLTERQSKCPLCKYDVFAFVQERAAQDPTPMSARRRRQSRRRRASSRLFSGGQLWFSSWMAVQGHEDPPHDDDDMGDGGSTTTAELELAETSNTNSSSGGTDRSLPVLS